MWYWHRTISVMYM